MTLHNISTLPIILSCVLGHSQALTAAEPADKPVLRIVYFTPNDRDPIPGCADRLEKVLEHVREFFRNGMAAAGYGQRTFNLDRKEDGSLRIFVVRGEHPTEKYGRDSGWIVQRECRQALLKEGVDLQQETVLIFNNLLLWEGKKAIEHGPYAGGGNHRNGFAWAYDDAMLDPAQTWLERARRLLSPPVLDRRVQLPLHRRHRPRTGPWFGPAPCLSEAR